MSTPYSEGPLNAPICLIGEAPAANEIAQSRPFVGDAGRRLDACLHQAGLLRSNIRIENVVRGRIESTSTYLTGKGLTEAGELCALDLKERLEEGSYKVLVPLGNLALCALTGQQAITKRRGSPLTCTLLPGKRVIPTIHPAATLPGRGKYLWIYSIVADMKKAKRHSEDLDATIPKRNLIIDPTHAECMDYLHNLSSSSEFALDIEVYNHQVSCMSFSPHPLSAISIPFLGRWTETDEMVLWRRIASLLEDDSIAKIGQNHVGFDIPFLYHTNKIYTRGEWGDCMLAQRILYPEFPSSLEYLCSMHTNEPYYKDDKKLWNTPHKDPHTFWEYNAKDSAVCMEIWPILKEELARDGYWQMYADTIDLAAPVHYMMHAGVRVNLDLLREIKSDVDRDLLAAEKELDEASDYPFNPISPKQCLAYFYVHKDIRPYTHRKTGKPTCDDKAMARIFRKHGFPEARLVQEIRALRKLKGTYLEMDFDPDGYIRCSYDLRGTTSGRLSSSKTLRGTGMNMQNLDPRFKNFLVTDKP